jgi:probable HAF family extracellular repeat protein
MVLKFLSIIEDEVMIKKLFPVILLGFFLVSQAIATGYTYKTIDPPTGAYNLELSAINDKGQVVGYYIGSDHHSHGFIYANGLFTTLRCSEYSGY